MQLRAERTPIAYIVGHKEFYGRLFRVTPATLIPRPESETIITTLREIIGQKKFSGQQQLVDVGTGSGCLGITAKLEFPQLHTTLLDVSQHALTVARKNAEKLDTDVTLLRSDLLESYTSIAQFIVANLPYVDPSWQRSPETDHEPSLALFAEDNGLRLIKKLLKQAPACLAQGGHLILEADERQHAEIIHAAQQEGFSHYKTEGLIVCLQKR
jgi:release factor glutamine methyltransferase